MISFSTSTSSDEIISQQALQQAAAACRDALGEHSVYSDEETVAGYLLNTSEFSARSIPLVLRPRNLEQVQAVVSIVSRYGIPVYPFSTGKNWGLGSKIPVRGPCALIELSCMNRIIEINEGFHYAVIEPGVTQQQLADRLMSSGCGLKMNVTDSAPETSIVGNVLDRGAGNLGARIHDLLSLEVVLGNGEVVRTGLWHFLEDSAELQPHVYPPGLGPDLTGLFVQSNFGVVTKMAIRLHRLRPVMAATIHIVEDHLGPLVDEIRTLREDNIIHGNVRLADGNAPNIKFLSRNGSPVWVIDVTVFGSLGMRREARREIDRRLCGLARQIDYFDSEADEGKSWKGDERQRFEIRMSLVNGVPSNSSIENIARMVGKSILEDAGDIDRDPGLPGFICVNASVPFSGYHVTLANRVVREIARKRHFNAVSSFSTLGQMALSGCFPFFFDRQEPGAVKRAHELKNDIHRRFQQIGIFPVRTDIDAMGALFVRSSDGFWKTVSLIKESLDPSSIISPGRYCPVSE